MRIYVYLAIIVIVIGSALTAVTIAYVSGKNSEINRIRTDQVQILRDGKRIDEEVAGSDDDSLYCRLVKCVQSDRKSH